MVICLGATPFMVNSSSPNGGVSRPSCMQIRNMTPNHTVSIPSRCTSGMKNGSVISIMLTWSTKQPRNSRITIMPISTVYIDSPCPAIRLTMPLVAPLKLSTCAKVVAPTMMNRMVPETATVPSSAFIRLVAVSLR